MSRCTGQLGRCVRVSVSYHRVAGMCLSVEQIQKEEMLTLCLREDTFWWTSRELKQGLGFIVDKNSYSKLVGYTICDYQHFRGLWHLHFRDKSKATFKMEAAGSSETLVNLYLTVGMAEERFFKLIVHAVNVFLWKSLHSDCSIWCCSLNWLL